MLKPDSQFDSIFLDKDGTLRFSVSDVSGVYEELKSVYTLVERCLEYLKNNAGKKFDQRINERFILETRLLERPDPRFGHLITLLNERILNGRGKVIGTPWQYTRAIDDPEITPV